MPALNKVILIGNADEFHASGARSQSPDWARTCLRISDSRTVVQRAGVRGNIRWIYSNLRFSKRSFADTLIPNQEIGNENFL